MTDEIEEFLRRAAQRRAGAKPRPVEILTPDVVEEVQVVEEPVVLLEEDVASHVAKHLDSSSFKQRAAHLGQRVGLADDVMEAHIEEKFEHRVGRFEEGERAGAGPAARPETAAGQIAQLLHSPQSIRQAIILSEVLNRPEHRW